MDMQISTTLTPDQREILSDFLLATHNIESELHRLLDVLQDSSTCVNGNPFVSMCRLLETIKGNLVFCGMVEISRFINHFVLACRTMIDGRYLPDAEIREAMLQGLDHAVQYVRSLLGSADCRERREALSLDPLMRRLASATSQAQANDAAVEIINYIAEAFEIESSLAHLPALIQFEQTDLCDCLGEAESRSISTLIAAQEKRNPYWKGRSQVQLDLVLAVNRLLPDPCDPRQLVLAVCLHDVGMMFLPDSILLKNSRLDRDETEQIHSHIAASCSLLGFSEDNADATLMIAQHHEHYDGSGYPAGLAGDKLSTGGQLIGLADAYFALTHQRPHRLFPSSSFRALVEMNCSVGRQFSHEIISAFNYLVRHQLGAVLHVGSAT
jgi:response regulator RpfG family c-di-GMP phosphodiesterase